MKKVLTHKMTAVIIAAVFVGCGGSNNQQPETHDEHAGHNASKAKDTTVIEAGQSVDFENLKNSSVVSSPLTIKFKVNGMEVEPMNPEAPKNKGHHHLLIDTLGFIPAGEMVPTVEKRIIHFGKGQTETKVELSKGKHKLSLQFADGLHRSYGVKMSKTIEVEVK